MQLTNSQKEKLNDFKNYMMKFNKNDEYLTFVIDTIFENVEKNYEEFSDEISKISVQYENDKLNILPPENGYYSLLDFLLNRVFKNILGVSLKPGVGNFYEYVHGQLIIDTCRYDEYYKTCDSNGERFFSDDFLLHQKKKSIMHESGHALQCKREKCCDISYFSILANQLQSLFGHKYNFNNYFCNISNRFFIIPFGKNSLLREGLNEMYASLFSGVQGYNLNLSLAESLYTRNHRKDADGKVRTSLKKNCFNAYSHDRYFYQMRALVSKQSIFNSMYFGKNDMIDEFYNTYKEIINKHVKNADSDIKDQIAYYTDDNLITILLTHLGRCYYIDDPEVYKYEKILDSIFLEAFEKKISLLTTKDKLVENTIGNMYNYSYGYVENGKYVVGSDEKVRYRELYEKVKKVNMILPNQQDNVKNTSNQNLNSSRMLVYGIFDVNVIKNPEHNFKVIIYFKNNNFEVNSIGSIGPSVFSIRKLIERYINKYKQELINNSSLIIDLVNNINSYIPAITMSSSDWNYENTTGKKR